MVPFPRRPRRFLPPSPSTSPATPDPVPISSLDSRPAGRKKRQRDGDRRRRNNLARQAQVLKRAAQNWNLDVGWTDGDTPTSSGITDRTDVVDEAGHPGKP
jgi:hypothetical protein